MKPLNIAFLWHMHQPCYIDGLTNRITLPWVRLHGIKAYYDMPLVQEEFENVKTTFNLVPSLLEQLDTYSKEGPYDLFYDISLKPAEELTPSDKIFLLKYFFSCNWPTMIQPHKGYNSLLMKRGSDTDSKSMEKALGRFTKQDFLDLQCWFNLAWFGFKALERKPHLKELINKSKKFTQEDKELVLQTQIEILREIPSIYKRLQDESKIEISVSPFYHPIIPVLIDSDSARIAMPKATLPSRFQFPEDANAQVTLAIDYYESLFGRKPDGLWPSEGSVSPEALSIFAEKSIKWIATDQEILEGSIFEPKDSDLLYRHYSCQTDSNEISVFFRDQNLSNLLSFTYHRGSIEHALENFKQNLLYISKSSKLENPTVSIILDGENPWEYYTDKGEGFLKGMYGLIRDNNNFKAISFSDARNIDSNRAKMSKIYSGSWINHNFNVWIGKNKTNKAWELIKDTREVLYKSINEGAINEQEKEAALKELYRAQGSDWFWWLSDFFYTDNGEEFERLLRTHLEKIYKIIKESLPWQLKSPITGNGFLSGVVKPKGLMSPSIDGKVTNFYEWVNSGVYEVKRAGSLMYEGKQYIKSINFGFDLENLYIRINPAFKIDEFEDISMCLHFFSSKHHKIHLDLPQKAPCVFFESNNGSDYTQKATLDTVKVGTIVEMALPFQLLEVKKGDSIKFNLSLISKEIELKKYPRNDFLSIEVPGEDFDDIMWMV